MKLLKTIGILAILMAFSVTAFAGQYLACNVQPNVIASEVEVDGTITPGIAVVSGSDLLLLDVSGLGAGPHQFKARLQDASGWWGPWNASPFDASRPEEAGLRIVDQ